METNDQTQLDNFVTKHQFVKQHPDKFTLAQIDWLLRNRASNGLQKAGAVSLVGRRFYINKPKFTAWLASQNK